MALKVFDGFDHYNAVADLLARSGFLQYQLLGFSNPVISFITGLTGYGRALRLTDGGTGDGQLRSVYTDRNQEAFVAFRVRFPNVSNAATGGYLTLYDTVDNSPQVTIRFNEANYSIQIWRGSTSGTSLYLSSNNVWTGDTPNFIEVGTKIANSGGYVTVKINGVVLATVTGVDTQNTTNSWFDAADWLPTCVPNNAVLDIDDVYYCDTAVGPGLTPCNTFLGDVRVATAFATGNDAVAFTPLSGQNWQMISEVAMDSDVSYNYSANAGDQDTFVFQPLSNIITTIFGLQITYAARKDDAGSRTMAGVIKISGTSYVYGTPDTVPASATYAYFTNLWILNPATGLNFTLSDVNAADYGYKLVT